MNLTMSVGHILSLLRVQVLQLHGNHGCLLLLDVKELNQTLAAASLEVPLASLLVRVALVLVKDLLNMPLAHLELIVLNDVQRSLNSARISAQSDLTATKVSQN
jgi:hypothetical protein